VDGKPFYGVVMTDLETGNRVCYEVDETFKFFIMWNDRGTKDYFCPEPMSWMINAPNLNLPAEETGYIELAPGESKTVTERIYTL
jgi:aldose 1-epimerase